MEGEDMADEQSNKEKERKCHNCAVGTWLKGQGCCTKITGKNNCYSDLHIEIHSVLKGIGIEHKNDHALSQCFRFYKYFSNSLSALRLTKQCYTLSF